MSDQLIARPLPKRKTTQAQEEHMQNIHVLCGIRAHNPGFRASEDSTCLRPSATVTGLLMIILLHSLKTDVDRVLFAY
jgi:hypothetical protein